MNEITRIGTYLSEVRMEPPADRLDEFYRLVRELIELRVSVGYDLDMRVDDGRYRVCITRTDGPLAKSLEIPALKRGE